jgi:hypothetical protein
MSMWPLGGYTFPCELVRRCCLQFTTKSAGYQASAAYLVALSSTPVRMLDCHCLDNTL